jgi:queuosine precursor transporter
MAVVVTASNVLVQYPINDWLTWGAITYPFAFLVTDLTNRRSGPAPARTVVYSGFVLAVGLSSYFSTVRIALASGSAFLTAQLTDVFVFNRLRAVGWWKPPLVSSCVASTLDTILFFAIAFGGTGLPWHTWAIGDFAVKLGMAVVMLIPYFLAMKASIWAPASGRR